MTNPSFDYQEAFSRNIGLLTEVEQTQLRDVTIALCGNMDVVSAYVIALVRQGFEKFKIMDVAILGSGTLTQGSPQRNERRSSEIETLKESVCNINPGCAMEFFSDRVNDDSAHDFFSGVGLVVDAIDSTLIAVRRSIYDEARTRSIPVLGAESDRFGVRYYVFLPSGPTFDDCFSALQGLRPTDTLLARIGALMPAFFHSSHISEPEPAHNDWQTLVGTISVRSGIVVIYALKILLKRGSIKAMPYYHQFDVWREHYSLRQLWWEKSSLWQRLKLRLAPFINN